MLGYLGRRLLQALPVVFGVSLITFFLIRLTPGDPVRVMLGELASPDAISYWRAYYHLDDPLPQQYLSFLTHVLTGNFGHSIVLKAPVAELIGARLGLTASLVLYSVTIALSLTVPLALLSAVRAGRPTDAVIRLMTMICFAMPSFWLGLVLVQIFSLRLGWFPTSGLRPGLFGLLWSLTLPAFTIGLILSPVLMRTLRLSIIESLRAEHVVAANARGLSSGRVMLRYVLRNSLIATVTVLGVTLGHMIGGSLIVENVFALPGLGTLIVGAVGSRDFPLVEAGTLFIGVSVVLSSILTDLVNAALDPRSRLQ